MQILKLICSLMCECCNKRSTPLQMSELVMQHGHDKNSSLKLHVSLQSHRHHIILRHRFFQSKHWFSLLFHDGGTIPFCSCCCCCGGEQAASAQQRQAGAHLPQCTASEVRLERCSTAPGSSVRGPEASTAVAQDLQTQKSKLGKSVFHNTVVNSFKKQHFNYNAQINN